DVDLAVPSHHFHRHSRESGNPCRQWEGVDMDPRFGASRRPRMTIQERLSGCTCTSSQAALEGHYTSESRKIWFGGSGSIRARKSRGSPPVTASTSWCISKNSVIP